ncbi:hypothetical protein PLICRDRAFT_409781 [Plicaturopsis crispa FD-325 SS-3]|nr:hypothetical protein PLICRDRAFT_409781 [Plicaturopsis crispa FD-325 SS-3]
MSVPDDNNGGGSTQNPWYKLSSNAHPFFVAQKLSPKDHSGLPFHSVAVFPWSVASIDDALWQGDLKARLPHWPEMIAKWSGSYAVGGSHLYVISSRMSVKPIRVKPPPDSGEIQNIAWALSQASPYEPLVVFSCASILYAVNVETREITSCLRGHGGPITSIATHPVFPYILCTTSRDFTARIYDLTLAPTQEPNNPHWTNKNVPSLGGAAHGLQMSEPEGLPNTIGRCVSVLVGGRSGGHQAAVLGAAFHPAYHLIATCGLDRVVKIWRTPDLEGRHLTREDKPLFSSSRLHKAGVCSIAWLNDDTLITHSLPALMRRHEDVRDDIYYEPGTVVLWRWLGLDRFFPPNAPLQKVLRGCASDYYESSSFKIISVYSLPMDSRFLHVFQGESRSHDPLVLFPDFDTIRLLNVTHFEPRKPPPFSVKATNIADMAKRMRIEDDDEDPPEENNKPPDAKGWTIRVNNEGMAGSGQREKLQNCVMGLDGTMVVGVSDRGNIYVWRSRSTAR